MRTKKRPPYREAITQVVEAIGAGVQFTQNDAWERLPEYWKERLASFYTESEEEGDPMETARKRFHNKVLES